MRTTAAALVVLAATGMLVTGCRGPAAGASGPTSSPSSATRQAEPGALNDVDATLDRLERELNSDADR